MEVTKDQIAVLLENGLHESAQMLVRDAESSVLFGVTRVSQTSFCFRNLCLLSAEMEVAYNLASRVAVSSFWRKMAIFACSPGGVL